MKKEEHKISKQEEQSRKVSFTPSLRSVEKEDRNTETREADLLLSLDEVTLSIHLTSHGNRLQ